MNYANILKHNFQNFKNNNTKDLSKSQNKLLNRKTRSASNQNIDKIDRRNNIDSFKAKPYNIVQVI